MKEVNRRDLIQLLYEAKIPTSYTSHWCSDLYLKKTPETTKVLEDYEFNSDLFVSTFIDQIERVPYYEVAFAWHTNEYGY